MGEVTQLLDSARQGDKVALERFYARVYSELDVIARSQLARQSPLTLIDAPSLVNEVYLRISRQESLPGQDRGTFLGYAARVMRSIIVDYVRARGAERRGGDQLRVTLVTDIEKKEFTQANFEELSGELESLERIDQRAYRVVELRFFGGMEIEEIARFLDTSPATVKRDWTKARMFLRHRLATFGGIAMNDSPDEALLQEAMTHIDGLLDKSRAERATLLGALAQSRPEVHALVMDLLEHEDAVMRGYMEPATSQAQPALRADSRLGPYRIIRLLGEGGMGEVWLASRDDGLYEGHVAIKTLHPYFAGGALRERFLREARVLGRLAHPNIARLLDAGIHEGVVYLVLEYVQGRPIDVACDEAKLDVGARLNIFMQLCAGVAHAHSSLVVHRDIKPGNVLLTPDGVPKLLDFGIANFYEPEAGGKVKKSHPISRA